MIMPNTGIHYSTVQIFVLGLPIVVAALVFLMMPVSESTSTKTMTNLASLSAAEAKLFFDSFDTIVSDCDGVLWNPEPIPGVPEVIAKLKAMGKKLRYLSNNSAKTMAYTKSEFKNIGIDLDENDLVHPVSVMIDYLKSNNFNKKIYLIGTKPIVDQFEAAGIECVLGINDYPDDMGEFVKNMSKSDDGISAVIVDVDLQVNYYKLSRAVSLLKNPDIMYFITGEDRIFKPIAELTLPGLYYFTRMITEISGREPMLFGKPSPYLKPIIFKQFNITEPQRAIFFGDLLVQDMGIATVCGFQKMFVLSGSDTLEKAEKMVNPAYKPDYWIKSEILISVALICLMTAGICYASPSAITDLSILSSDEAKIFLDSFDTIVSDCDGVLWSLQNHQPIPGIREVVTTLKSIGKKLHFLTNSSAKTKKYTRQQFTDIGIDLDPKNLIHPILTIIDYLKSINFTKKIFLIGSDTVRTQFEAAGIQCVKGINDYPDDMDEFVENVTNTADDVGGVVLDMDTTINYFKISKAIALLRNPDILYMTCNKEKHYKLPNNLTIPGTGYFVTTISELSGREPMLFGKPSTYLKQIIFKQFNITDPRRTIFFGDTLESDMGMASVCGFQKMFVLSGVDSLKAAENTVNPAYRPDYWVESIGHLKHVIDKSRQQS